VDTAETSIGPQQASVLFSDFRRKGHHLWVLQVDESLQFTFQTCCIYMNVNLFICIMCSKSHRSKMIYIYRCTDNFPIIIPITISMYGGFQTVPRFIAGGYMHGSWAQQIVYGKRRVAVLWPVTDFRTRINFLCLFWIAKSSFLRLQSLQSLFLVAYPISIAYVTISQHPLASKFALKYTNQIWRVNWNLKVGWLTTISMILLSTLYLVVTWLNQVQSMRLNLAPSSEQSWFTTHNII
jgi:hypothetical protein